MLLLRLTRRLLLQPGAGAAAPRRLYHENVIEHYENPRNVGKMDRNDPSVGTGMVGPPAPLVSGN